MSRPPPREHERNPPTLSIASILASGASNVMASTLIAAEEEHSTTVQLAAAVSSTMASTLTLADARDTALPDPSSGSSNTSPIEPDRPVLEISGLQETLRDIELSNHFRDFLRRVDRNTSAPPEVKGRFERYFDFHIKVLELLDVPQDDLNRQNKLMIELHQDFFSSPSQTISISSQGALRKLKEHLKELKQINEPSHAPNLDLVHPVHEEVYEKLNSKHGQWKMNYKPTTSLNTLMCMLS
ncbi:hypothetical protein TCAL_15918 [Tigriopus californicus]|uniref:RGS domain-containing protein n=1 Tax=Tigriopus californicus TaxID=6832 RepID=A0A553PH19_TIGCA|nr:uncharacterized protein LOC131880996 [Tigriopus californicus]TRY76979.1 hypothetical protein TCAL_15918 [Tigriopus californicus]